MIKKALKIIGILVLILLIALISIPFLFGDTIKDKIKLLANEHVDAKVNFADVDISLLRNFPKASIIIDDFSLINNTPFEGDTLAYVKKIALNMSISQLFKSSDDPISVQRFSIDEAYITVKTDSLGNSNLDITKETEQNTTTEQQEESTNAFSFELDHYEINNSKLIFQDDQSKMLLEMSNINHVGDGVLSGSSILLDTKSSTEASLFMDETQYLNKNTLQLEAALELDLENQRYTFKENKFYLNQLPLHFDGFVQLNEKDTGIDITFETPTSDFKNFLAVIPKSYSKDLDGVQTTGSFAIKGMAKGKIDDTSIPKIDVNITSNNASFKYPDLPKGVQNITIDTKIKNDTGNIDDTYINIGNLTFRIDQDIFTAKGSLRNITKNMIVDLGVNGTLNLANLNQAYPLELEEKLNGILQANINTKFDMASLEKEQYQNVKSSGNAKLNDFTYASDELPNEIHIQNASVSLKPETITLDNINVTTGKSDLSANGTINNLMGFLFAKQDLKGTFDVNSEVFAVSDFMVSANETEIQETTNDNEVNDEALQIPSFLDATLNFDAKKVLYDNLELRNTKGSVKIKDETAYLQDVTSNIFDGSIEFNGNVSTKSITPSFKMDLDLDKINIAKSFASLELLQSLAPIAKSLTGALTTQISLGGDLSKDLTPVLNSLTGNALANILNAKVNSSATPLLSKLDNKINFLNLDKLNLKDIKTHLSFDNGKINVKPFEFKVDDITVTAGGSHGFDMNMDYKVAVNLPAKYLGNEVGGLYSKLNSSDTKNMTVPLPVGVTGSFSNPKVNVNTKGAITDLTKQIVDKQKGKVKDKIVGEGGKVLTGLLGGNKKENNTSQTNNKAEDKIKDVAKDVLGGLFGKKKKKDTIKSKN